MNKLAEAAMDPKVRVAEMPLLESRKSRTKRLMSGAAKSAHERVYQWIPDLSMPAEEARYYGALYPSWIVGGVSTAAGIVNQIERFDKAWGKGDEAKALRLTEAFTLAMSSFWYRDAYPEREHQQNERTEAVRASAANVLAFFGREPDLTIANFLAVDTQLNSDLDAREEGSHMWGYALLSWLAEGPMTGQHVDYGAITLPVRDSADLAAFGVPLLLPNDMLAVVSATNHGGIAMHQAFNTLFGDDETGSTKE